ncbi:MAG TPA: Mur ligase family protein [Candidatus Polarisedimenticolia bacterium]|nr:Mur ligase family protein [Candidatus Polarisedimenticolia bacterium]
MRVIEIRLLEGPNVYRLEPLVKVEIAIGRRRTWYGRRDPAAHALVLLGARVPKAEWPDPVLAIVDWARRLRREHGEGSAGVAVHRSSDPGHWIITWPWLGAERARLIAEATIALLERNVSAAPRARLTGGQARALERWNERIQAAGATPPSWVRDSERRVPVVSISGTNGKSTTTRLITRILLRAGKHVGTTTSDGVLVDERLVEPGDWTGPGGAAAILGRSDIDVAVLETARGGIVLRGVGYESNEVSILTNVSSDHLDLQGIHTLPELAEVKSTICLMTKPDGWAILNADDEFVAAIARRVRAKVAFFTLEGERSARVKRHLAQGGRAYLVRRGELGEMNGRRWSPIVAVRDIPIAFGGLARHNVANALAASAGARGLGASIEDVARGLTDFRPTAATSPGRLNVFRNGARIVIIDFAHNEAGTNAVMDVAEGIAAGSAGRMAPITIVIGTAGDRPDDTLRGIGRIAAQRAQRVVIKESLHYLRGRSRESVVGELLEGVAAGGKRKDEVKVYESETAALRAEANGNGPAGAPRIVVLFVHEDRDGVMRLLPELGFRPVESPGELEKLVPRLEDRPRRS